MTLLTCSNYSSSAYRLFDSFRKIYPDAPIVWIIADTDMVSIELENRIESYFGNLSIYYYHVDKGFWAYAPCIHQPQWSFINEVIQTIPDDEVVIRCDANDVLFQTELYLPPLIDDVIKCSYEGMSYRDNLCCLGWWDEEKAKMFIDEPVINSGVLIANAKTFKKLAYTMAYGPREGVMSDQNLLDWSCRNLGITLEDDGAICAIYGKPYETAYSHKDNKHIKVHGAYPAIVHFNGRNAEFAIQQAMENVYSDVLCDIHEVKMLSGREYKTYTIGCYITSKNRLGSLKCALLSLSTQTLLPDYICFYNDGDVINVMENFEFARLVKYLNRKGILFEYKEGDKRTQTSNHNRASYEMPCDYIIRLDDDGYAEANMIEEFYKLLSSGELVMVGGHTKWADKIVPYKESYKNEVKGYYTEGENIAWTEFDSVIKEPLLVDHLHGHCYGYTKHNDLHYPEGTTEFIVTEETVFCIEAKKLGYLIYVTPTTGYWHFQPKRSISRPTDDKKEKYVIELGAF